MRCSAAAALVPEAVRDGRGGPRSRRRSCCARSLLQVLYSVRSERQLMEQLDYNLLFRWFVGLNMDDAVWDATVFTKNRDRLLDGDIAEAFFQVVLSRHGSGLLSDEHFTVDGTLIEAWARQKSFQRKDAKKPLRRTIPATRPSTSTGRSGPTKRINRQPIRMRRWHAKEGKEAKLSYIGNLLVENRNGLMVNTGCRGQRNRRTRCGGGDAGTDSGGETGNGGSRQGLRHGGVRGGVRNLKVTPHVAQNTKRTAAAPLMSAPRGTRIWDEPEEAEAGGRGLRLAEDDRAAAR